MGEHPSRTADTLSLRTGARMPVIGLGTWQLTDDTAGTSRRPSTWAAA